MKISKSQRITAAEGDEILDDDSQFEESLNDIAENIEDMQDDIDDIQEDDVDIELDNNIEGHYIAECEKCQGVFTSAVMETEDAIEKVSGVCPICKQETDQYLKWVIKSAQK